MNETDNKPSFYTISQKASIAAWNSVRQSMLKAVTESCAMPDTQVCMFCFETSAQFRCIQCGQCSYYCDHCLPKLHSCANIFHVPEQWKVSILLLSANNANSIVFISQDESFVPIVLEGKCINPCPGHTCSTTREVPVCCLDENGRLQISNDDSTNYL